MINGSFNAADTNVLTVSFNGTTYTLNGGGATNAKLTSSGNTWSLDVQGTTLTDGTYAVVATAYDIAGNSSADTQNVTIDTNAPGQNGDGTAPAITGITNDSNISTDYITNDQTLVFNGTAGANEVVTVKLDGATLGTATANGSGVWSYNHTATTLANGTYSLTASTTDVAGNTATATQAITIDTNAPGQNGDGTAPAITGITNDSNISTDYITNDQTLVFNGTAGANEVVTVKLDGATLGTATANGSGVWSYNHTATTLANGTYSLTASTDIAGNTASATQAVVIDTTAPGTTGLGPIDITAPTDTGTNDTTTGHGNPVITFTGEAGLTISLIGADGTTPLIAGTQYTVAYAGGTYTVTLLDAIAGGSADPYGTYSGGVATGNTASVTDGTYTIKATDLAANTSTVGTFVIDTTALSIPTVVAQTNVLTQPTLTGTFDATAGGLTVTVDSMTYTLGRDAALTAHDNTWTLDLAAAGQTLSVKSYEIVAAATDKAGNTSTDKSSMELTVIPVPLPPVQATLPAVIVTPPPAEIALPPANKGSIGSGPVLDLTSPNSIVIWPSADETGRGKTPTEGFMTSGEREAFRIVVVKADEPGLFRFHGVPDQDFDTGTHIRFQLPADAFMHTQENAIVRITAERTDGGPLPAWLRFNATTGTFEGDAPPGSPRVLEIRVTARDTDGREASTIFRIKLHGDDKQRPAGRTGLTDQIRMSAQHRSPYLQQMVIKPTSSIHTSRQV